MRSFLISLALIAFSDFSIAQQAAAQTNTRTGDAKVGEQLAYTCSGCHGIANYKNAYPQYHVPKISGQNYEYLVVALKGYQDGSRSHPTMRAQALSFSDTDIADLAMYLSTLSPESK
jgi:cytochrome c553